MINWKNDPLVYGKKYEYVIDENDRIINVFRSLIRPEDFVDKNFLLRTPYVTGNELIKEFNCLMRQIGDDAVKMLIKSIENYCGFKYTTFHNAVYKYKQMLERNRINLIVLRGLSLVSSEISEKSNIKIFLNLVRKVEYVCGSRGIRMIKLPLTLNELLSDQNTYLAGVICGDGMLSDAEIIIGDGHPDLNSLKYSKEYILFIKRLIEKEYRIRCRTDKEGKMWKLKIYNKWLSRLLRYFFEMETRPKCALVHEPNILKKFGSSQRRFFWRGVVDTDGNVSHNVRIRTTSRSLDLVRDFKMFCDSIGIKLKIEEVLQWGEPDYRCYVNSPDLLKFAENVGLTHPRKKKQLLSGLKKGPSYLVFKELKKEFITSEGYYDLASVPKLCAYGLSGYLCRIRKDLKCNLPEMGKLFGTTMKRIWRYENERMPIPIKVLVKAEKFRGNEIDYVYSNLEKLDVNFCIPGALNKVKLPLRPTKDVLKVIGWLRPRKGGTVYIRLTDDLRLVDSYTMKKRLKLVENLFNIKPCEKKGVDRRSKQYCVYSVALKNFVKTFHKYGLPWEPQSDKDLEKILRKLVS